MRSRGISAHIFVEGVEKYINKPQPLILNYKKTTDDTQVKETLNKMKFMPVNWGPEETEKKVQKEFDATREVLKRVGLLQ